MSRAAIAVVFAGGLLACSGCTKTERIAGHRGKIADQFFGEVGITGHQNEVTIKAGSSLDKLSIIGDGNKVEVEDGVVLAKVEIWGENDMVTIPERLIVRDYVVGVGSKILRRPRGAGPAPLGPEGDVLRRVPLESEAEQPMTPQQAPANTPARDSGPAESNPGMGTVSPGGNGTTPSSPGSGTTVTPAGDRVIPAAGVHPGSGQ